MGYGGTNDDLRDYRAGVRAARKKLRLAYQAFCGWEMDALKVRENLIAADLKLYETLDLIDESDETTLDGAKIGEVIPDWKGLRTALGCEAQIGLGNNKFFIYCSTRAQEKDMAKRAPKTYGGWPVEVVYIGKVKAG